MKYIENDGHITREFEVKINVENLESIIKELDSKCYRIVNRIVKVSAYNKEDAIEKINLAINSAKIKVNQLVKISDGYHDFVNNPQLPYIYDCECICKESSQLVYILKKLISNYQSRIDFKEQNNKLLDDLINYQNSEELLPYSVRIKDCYDEIKNYLNINSNDFVQFNSLNIKFDGLIHEFEQNKEYDFVLLYDLYKQALECFKLVILSETVHYKDKNNKVYRLGVKEKNIN